MLPTQLPSLHVWLGFDAGAKSKSLEDLTINQDPKYLDPFD